MRPIHIVKTVETPEGWNVSGTVTFTVQRNGAPDISLEIPFQDATGGKDALRQATAGLEEVANEFLKQATGLKENTDG